MNNLINLSNLTDSDLWSLYHNTNLAKESIKFELEQRNLLSHNKRVIKSVKNLLMFFKDCGIESEIWKYNPIQECFKDYKSGYIKLVTDDNYLIQSLNDEMNVCIYDNFHTADSILITRYESIREMILKDTLVDFSEGLKKWTLQ